MQILALLLFLPAVLAAHAGIDSPLTVDFSGRTAPALDVYASNVKTFRVSLLNTGAAVNLTGYTPAFYWAVSNQATSVVTAQCSIVSTSGGVFNATLSASDLNYAGGSYIYGVGVTSNGTTTARQGVLRIIPDPLASGAGPVTWTTNLNWSLYTFVDSGANGPYLFAGASLTTNTRGQVTVTITGATASAAFSALTGSPYDNTLLGSALTGTSNGAVASARSQAVTSVWTAAQYAGALLTDGSRVADYLIVGSELFLDNYPGYGIVGTMESNGFSLVAGPGTNATLDFSQPAVIWHWQGGLDLFASTNSNFDIAFYSGPDSLERMRVDYDGNVYVANTVTAAQFSGSAPWSILTNAPPGMTPDNTASVTWQATATSAQGVVTWQATAIPTVVIDGSEISVNGIDRRLEQGSVPAFYWGASAGTGWAAVPVLVVSNAMTLGGVTRTNWPTDAGAETDPIWQASGVSNRVVTLEGYTGRLVAVEGYTSLVATAIQPGSGAYDLSLGTNAPAAWTTDTGATGIVAGASNTYDPNTRVLTWNTNGASGGGAAAYTNFLFVESTGRLHFGPATNAPYIAARGLTNFVFVAGTNEAVIGW